MRTIVATLLAGASLVVPACVTAEPAPAFKLMGQFTLSTGVKLNGVEFGGISGLEYDAGLNRFIALSDDRAERGPARFYELEIGVDSRGIASFEVQKAVPLTDAEGRTYGLRSVDPEDIRLLPNGTLIWADEGGENGNGPALIEATRAGRRVGTFPLPEHYAPSPDQSVGVRRNLGHEGIAVRPDGREFLAFMENALAQDGPIATLEQGSPARVVAFDIATRRAIAEYVYVTEPIPTASTRQPPVQDNGVSSAIYLRDGRLIVVERSFAAGIGNTIQMFRVEIADATNVLDRPKLMGAGDIKPLKKSPLGVLKPGEAGRALDNIEAIAQGPDVDGKPTLMLFSDNNFNRAQANLILMLQLVE